MYKSCIEYKGKAYPIVDMEASVEGWGNVVIGTMSLQCALFPGYGMAIPADREAEEIDNTIYFYVDDDEIDREDLAEIVMQSTGDEFERPPRYTESVMRNVRQTLDLEPEDTSCDEEINKMDEEAKAFDLRERAAKVTDDLKGWQWLLVEDEVTALEDVYQKLMTRLLAEAN